MAEYRDLVLYDDKYTSGLLVVCVNCGALVVRTEVSAHDQHHERTDWHEHDLRWDTGVSVKNMHTIGPRKPGTES